MAGTIGGFIVAMITTFKRTWSPVLAPVYALLEGLVLGGLSAFMEMRFPGIAVQAVGLTMAVFVGMMLAYKTGFIQATDGFKRGVFAVTAGIAIFYLVSFVLSMFHVQFMP